VYEYVYEYGGFRNKHRTPYSYTHISFIRARPSPTLQVTEAVLP
jgi:hypothetical protein